MTSPTHTLTANKCSVLFKYFLLLLMLVLSIFTSWLASTGQLTSLDERLLGNLFHSNDAFIDSAEDRAESMTLTLSELHAGLLVLQSSEFGISFIVDANIQLGNIVAQATDLVAYGRNFALFNLVALHVIDNTLKLVQWLTPWLILVAEAGLLSILIADTWLSAKNRWHMSLIRFGEGAVITVLLLVIIFPFSINLVRQSSEAVTESLYHESYQALLNTQEHILSSSNAASIKDDASETLALFKNARVKLSEKSSYLASNLTRYVAVTMMEVFLLPMLFTLFLLWLTRSIIRRHTHWNH
ncbi:hypothetical protein [Endozoicomonas numazuensis]|uniref:Uncharacterized protein n=1 Tax=Endozoicomonas numazuensis TaxID=1137799 RepID=A0A081NK60_9GAMM|nr:hypothetical protein [Endozoicomonas numazuensis]KEQ18833.1 hypothetical protein GZ78_01790 [Endozoicomonas numazuensis]